MELDMMYGASTVAKDHSTTGTHDWTVANPALNVVKGLKPAQSMYGNRGTVYETSETITNLTTSAAFHGGILTPKGTIIMIPDTEISAVEFNPYTKSIDRFGLTPAGDDLGASTNKWKGGVLAPDGNIYCFPTNDSYILKIDPTRKICKRVGTPISQAYHTGGIAPNGMIYGFPGQATNPYILEFDYVSGVATQINITSTSTNNFGGGCLGPDGKFYCAPLEGDQMLEFDPITKRLKVHNVPDLGGSNTKFQGAVLGPDGNIYCIPSTSSQVLKFNPFNKKGYAVPGYLTTTTLKWRGGVLAPNGCIYGIPFGSSDILKIDVKNNISTLIPLNSTIPIASSKWSGGIMHPDGNIYAMTYSRDTILKINLGLETNKEICLSRELNNF